MYRSTTDYVHEAKAIVRSGEYSPNIHTHLIAFDGVESKVYYVSTVGASGLS